MRTHTNVLEMEVKLPLNLDAVPHRHAPSKVGYKTLVTSRFCSPSS